MRRRTCTVFSVPWPNSLGLVLLSALAAFWGLTLAGCTSEPAPAPQQPASSPQVASSSGGSAPNAAEVKLAPAGEPTPPLDGGRLQATMPQGWKFLPRSSDYLFAAYHEDKTGVPRLILTEHEAADLPTTDSADTAQELAAKISAEVGAGDDAAITSVNVGDNWFVRYEKAKRFRSQSARGVTLETVRDGKRYRIELLTYTDAQEEFLPALYRFAASLEFQGSEASPDAEEPTPEEPAGDPPITEPADEPGEAADADSADS